MNLSFMRSFAHLLLGDILLSEDMLLLERGITRFGQSLAGFWGHCQAFPGFMADRLLLDLWQAVKQSPERLMSAPYWLWIFVHNVFGIARWVNVYTVTRSFGGREAGGWYYLKHDCAQSRQVGFWDAEVLRIKWLKQYAISHKWGDVALGGQDVVVCIEPRKAARQTKVAPIYNRYPASILLASIPKA